MESEEVPEPPEEVEVLPNQFSWADIKQYFYTEGNWRYLAGTSMCWFLLDVSALGMFLSQQKTLTHNA